LFVYDKDSGNILKKTSVPSGEVTEFVYDKRCTTNISSISLSKAPAPQEAASRRVSEFLFDSKCNLRDASEYTVTKAPDLKTAENSQDITAGPLDRKPLAGTPKEKRERVVWITLEYNKNGKISFLRDRLKDSEVAFTYW